MLRYKIQLFQNLTFEIQGQGHGWRQNSKSQSVSNFLFIHTSFIPCQSAFLFLWYSLFNSWPWKSRVKVTSPWCCTTTCLDNSIELQVQMDNVNPSSGFRDICSAKSGSQWYLIWQVLGPWTSPYMENGQVTIRLLWCYMITGRVNFIEFWIK